MSAATFRVGLRDGVCIVGRDPACDVMLVDPRVSQRHLSITRTGVSRWEVTDLGSRNGAFLGGRRLGTATITGSAQVVLGPPDTGLVLDLVAEPSADAPTVTGSQPADTTSADPTRQAGRDTPAGILVRDLVVRRGRRELLSGVTASVPAAKLTAIIGPSGAGKSTLLAALTGAVPATSGRVLIDGQDPAQPGSGLAPRMGVVPQADVLHTTLTVRVSLNYSAKLRMPAGTSRAERAAVVNRVLGQLRLTAHAGTRIDRLSGGQRKRVNAASELLTRPSLLVLDEPTSGLDPHLERTVMQDLAALAHDGCTVVVVTHSTATLDLADHVIAVGAGRLLYEGPPEGLPGHFDARGMGTVFAEMGGESVQEWAERWRTGGPGAPAAPQRRATLPALPLPQLEPAGSRRHQLLPLISRNLRLLAADRGSLALLLLQAPALGLLTRLFSDGGGFSLDTAPNADVRTLVLVLVLAATWLGTFAAIRQIVDERPVVVREFAAGVSPLHYLTARSAVLAVLVVVQVLCLTGTALFGRSLPAGQVLTQPGVELVITLIAAGWAAATVGLLVSAAARSGAGAAALAPLVVVPQLLLCGALLAVHENLGLDLVTRLVSARAAFSAAASSVDLVGLEAGGHVSAPPGAWSADGVTWCLDVLELAGLGAVVWLAVWLLLRRLSRPAR
jgi:ABC-type multidrug transport system ATPase subunit